MKGQESILYHLQVLMTELPRKKNMFNKETKAQHKNGFVMMQIIHFYWKTEHRIGS